MRIGIDDVIELVSAHFRVEKWELQCQRKDNHIARPRQMAFLLCREFTDASYPRIGTRFGGRDHSTVIHGIARVKDRVAYGKNKDEMLSLARLRHLLEERKNRDYDQAYALAWQTWAFIHRPQFMERSSLSPLRSEQRPAP